MLAVSGLALAESRQCRVVPAHPMYAASRRRGGGAEEKAGDGGGPGGPAGDGAGEELRPVLDAAVDVAANVVGVVPLHSRGRDCMAGEDKITEAGGEPLDLGLDSAGHVYGAAVRDVAVTPCCVLARGGAGGVEEALLGEQDIGPVADFAVPRRPFRRRKLGACPAEMHGSGPRDFG